MKMIEDYRNMYNEYRENVYDYLCKVYGYDTMDQATTESIVKAELRGLVYDGDDNMKWISPDNHYKFIITREELSDYLNTNPNQYQEHYKITIDIYENETGRKIDSFNFNEISSVRILDDIASFNDYGYQTGDSTHIYIDPSGKDSMISRYIYLENLSQITTYQKYGKEYTHDDDVLFSIYKYSFIEQKTAPVISMKLSIEELNDLCFHIFFESLIDIDIDDPKMDHVENFIVYPNNNYNNQYNYTYNNEIMPQNEVYYPNLSEIDTPTTTNLIHKPEPVKYGKLKINIKKRG